MDPIAIRRLIKNCRESYRPLRSFEWIGTPAVSRWKQTFALLLGALSLLASPVDAEPNRVTFPKNLDQLVHYATVRRGEVTEHMLTTQIAIDAIKRGQPVPNGTHFVLVDYRKGGVHRYFVMEKGEGFGADYDERRRTADWQFQWFWPDRSINMSENTARCQSCHQSQANSEYLFTGHRIPRFNGAPVD